MRLIDFVDCKHNRHTGSRSVVDGLDGLRHHGVVGCHNDDTYIGYLGTAGTHGGKCLMARSVEEGYVASVGQLHTVRTYVLGYTACLAGDYVGVADIVEQRSLAVVDVTHYGHNRRTADQI